MTGRRRAGLALALAGALAAAARPEETKTEDSVRVEQVAGAVAVRASIAGAILGVATPRRAGGGRAIVLLVTPPRPTEPEKTGQDADCHESPGSESEREPKPPKRLVHLDPAGAGALVTLRDDLPGDARAITAADLDGDGTDELLMTTEDGVDVLRAAAGSGRFGTEARRGGGPAAAASGTLEPGAVRTGKGKPDVISVAALGVLRGYSETSDGAWTTSFDAELPLEAKHPRWGLDLTSPGLRLIRAPDAVDVVVSAPSPRGPDRLQSILVRPGAPDGERRIESFSKLPGPERLLESEYVLLDGRPALAVTTMPATKLSIFGEKLLRVFFVVSDRTRLGKPPVLAVESGANLWQETHVTAADVNGDGHQDLVLTYWKGLKDDTVVLDAYLRKPDGSFEKSPRTSSFDVEEANRDVLLYGSDFDGAGLPDLLLVADGKLQFHPGAAASPTGRKLVETKPRWVVPFSSARSSGGQIVVSIGSEGSGVESRFEPSTAPRAVDLDGDGRMEILVTGEGAPSRSHALLVLPER